MSSTEIENKSFEEEMVKRCVVLVKAAHAEVYQCWCKQGGRSNESEVHLCRGHQRNAN